MGAKMIPNPDRDPRLAALAELLHQIRPTWDRAGIRSALRSAAPNHTLPTVTRAALDAAFDTSATTPAVIKNRDGTAWKLAQNYDGTSEKTPAFRTPPGQPPLSVADLPQPGDYTRGAAQARALIRAAKCAAQDAAE